MQTNILLIAHFASSIDCSYSIYDTDQRFVNKKRDISLAPIVFIDRSLMLGLVTIMVMPTKKALMSKQASCFLP